MRPIIIQWQLSSFTGWGIYGLNLALQWSADPELVPLTSVPFDTQTIIMDGLRQRQLAPLLVQSRQLQDEILRNNAGGGVGINAPVLTAMGNGLGMGRAVDQVALSGTPTIGVIFFEDTRLPAPAVAAACTCPLIVTGSRWNEEVLRDAGIERVRTVWQGIDPTLFHPAPRSGWFRDRFVVFSGGKLEPRKGQDIVLRTFRLFAQSHPESLLVTAWHSAWPQFARDFGSRHSIEPVPFTTAGGVDVHAWAVANGVRHDAIIDVGPIANAFMPTILREADVALFPNRAEGGTNLVAMEAMACGVPCILSRNTGHRDIIDGANCYALERQTPVAGEGTDGWGESDVDEIVETLESVWRDREEAAARGARGAATMAALSWTEQARQLKEAVVSVVE